MPIGVGAAMLIGSAASAGAGLAAAKVQSNAAKKAQAAQQSATNQALDVQRQQNAPYLQLGQQAANRIGQMAGNFQPYTQVFGGGRGAQMPTGLSAGAPTMQGPPQGPPPGSLASLGQPQGPMMPPRLMMPPQGAQAPPQAMPRQAPPMPQGPMVRLPDGRMVPASMLAQPRGL